MRQAFDIAVIGAGHAGCEAALAAARCGAKVLLVTLRLGGIAQMSCNPAVGGVGKGHLVREIDALGGLMGQAADFAGIQFRRLNMSRGPAVRSTRVQCDSAVYKDFVAATLQHHPDITLYEDEVCDLLYDRSGIRGIHCQQHGQVAVRAVVITTGTFLNGLCHTGSEQFSGGRVGDKATSALSAALSRLGLTLGRFKTGTTPRLATDSIDFSQLEVQHGDMPPPRFSFEGPFSQLPQLPCHMTYTQATTHDIIRDNLHRSPLYRGIIKGLGPRYCPSLEDKVVRFASRSQHQIFLEPETSQNERIYPAGLSTSLPKEAQEAFLRTIPGLSQVRIVQYGYAVEYDYVAPTELHHSLMVRRQPGLFLAGQINGTSGYEEAAAQGLMAGLNAARYVAGQSPAVLRRDEAYIGVLIDDLVMQGVDEPYRVFTARAEHRLHLRESNAEDRLTARARDWSLLSDSRYRRVVARRDERSALRAALQASKLTAETPKLAHLPDSCRGTSFEALLRRSDVCMADLPLAGDFAANSQLAVEEEIKYAGYIEREAKAIEKLSQLEAIVVPESFSFAEASGLSNEVREKLATHQPKTLGQASRIPGITPAALSILRVYLRSHAA